MKKLVLALLIAIPCLGQIGTTSLSPPIPGNTIGVNVNSYQSLASAVAACGGSACDLYTSGANYPVTSSLTIPVNIRPRFIPGGSWTIGSGATVTISGGYVTANAGQQIFFGAGTVAGLMDAYADWFATPSNNSYPDTAIPLAYGATIPYATIRFSVANYISDWFTHTGIHKASDPRNWIGAGMPRVDQIGTASGPQRMVNGSGTVLQGEFVVTSNDTLMQDFGVDYGAWVIANIYGGVIPFAQNGLEAIANGNTLDVPGYNMRWKNLTSLVVAQAGAHTSLLENYFGCSADNIWDYQPVPAGATSGWGFIDKSAYCTYSNIHVFGAELGGIYSKADHGSNPNGASHNNVWTNVNLAAATTNRDAGRVLIHGAAGDSNYGSEISGLSIDNAQAGVQDMADGGGSVVGWKLSNVSMTNMQGAAFFLNFATDLTVNGYTVTMAAEDVNGVAFIGFGVTRPNFYKGRITTVAGGNGFNICGNGDRTKGGVIDGMYMDGSPNTGVDADNTTPVCTGATGSANGWQIRNWRSVGHTGAVFFLTSGDNFYIENADAARTNFDVNGVYSLGFPSANPATHFYLRDVTARGASGFPTYGVVSYSNSTIVDHLVCETCAYTAVGMNTTAQTLMVTGVSYINTPTMGAAPYYQYSANFATTNDSTVVNRQPSFTSTSNFQKGNAPGLTQDITVTTPGGPLVLRSCGGILILNTTTCP